VLVVAADGCPPAARGVLARLALGAGVAVLAGLVGAVVVEAIDSAVAVVVDVVLAIGLVRARRRTGGAFWKDASIRWVARLARITERIVRREEANAMIAERSEASDLGPAVAGLGALRRGAGLWRVDRAVRVRADSGLARREVRVVLGPRT